MKCKISFRSITLYIKKGSRQNVKSAKLNFNCYYFGIKSSFSDLLSWLRAFYEATDACMILALRTVENQADDKSRFKNVQRRSESDVFC